MPAFDGHIAEGLRTAAVMILSGIVLGFVSDRLLRLIGLRDRRER